MSFRLFDQPPFKVCTHLSDRYAPFFTKLIAATASEALHVLDALLCHQSDVPTRRHHIDGGGDRTGHRCAPMRKWTSMPCAACSRYCADDRAATWCAGLARLRPPDLRKGIDGLALLAQQVLNEDPFSGALFAFRGRGGVLGHELHAKRGASLAACTIGQGLLEAGQFAGSGELHLPHVIPILAFPEWVRLNFSPSSASMPLRRSGPCLGEAAMRAPEQ